MTRSTLPATLAAALIALALPGAALALPSVGDVLGTDPDTVRAALDAQGCPVSGFEAEDGKIEAKCEETATGKAWEIYIDPATGAVAQVKSEED
jgi:hypothetical protein